MGLYGSILDAFIESVILIFQDRVPCFASSVKSRPIENIIYSRINSRPLFYAGLCIECCMYCSTILFRVYSGDVGVISIYIYLRYIYTFNKHLKDCSIMECVVETVSLKTEMI